MLHLHQQRRHVISRWVLPHYYSQPWTKCFSSIITIKWSTGLSVGGGISPTSHTETSNITARGESKLTPMFYDRNTKLCPTKSQGAMMSQFDRKRVRNSSDVIEAFSKQNNLIWCEEFQVWVCDALFDTFITVNHLWSFLMFNRPQSRKQRSVSSIFFLLFNFHTFNLALGLIFKTLND